MPMWVRASRRGDTADRAKKKFILNLKEMPTVRTLSNLKAVWKSELSFQGEEFNQDYLWVHSWSCLNLYDPMNSSPPGTSVRGFPRQEYWSGISSSKGSFISFWGSSQPRDWTCVSCLPCTVERFLRWATWETVSGLYDRLAKLNFHWGKDWWNRVGLDI